MKKTIKRQWKRLHSRKNKMRMRMMRIMPKMVMIMVIRKTIKHRRQLKRLHKMDKLIIWMYFLILPWTRKATSANVLRQNDSFASLGNCPQLGAIFKTIPRKSKQLRGQLGSSVSEVFFITKVSWGLLRHHEWSVCLVFKTKKLPKLYLSNSSKFELNARGAKRDKEKIPNLQPNCVHTHFLGHPSHPNPPCRFLALPRPVPWKEPFPVHPYMEPD